MRAERRALSAVVLVAALAIGGCGRGGEPEVATGVDAAPGTVILRRGNGPEPESLDPQKARQDSSLNLLRDLFEGLTSLDSQGAVIPGAAESWSVSEDGRDYSFRLRKGLAWSNGDAVTADDFVFAFRRLVDPATASPYGQILDPLRNASAIVRGEMPAEALGVEALDASTLVVRLTKPTPYVLGLLAHPSTFPVHRASLERHGERFAEPGHLVSNGAFVLTEWVLGSHAAAVRNERYWNASEVKFDGVRYYHMADAATELRRYRAGELDLTYTIPSQQYEWLVEHLGDELHIAPQLATYYYGFNLTRPPFAAAPELRRALAMAIDRDRLVQQVTGVGELPACSWVPSGIAGYTPQEIDYCAWPRERRVAEARRLYAQAGYSATNPLHTEIRYNTGEVHARIAVAIAAMWKQTLGVETEMRAEEFRVMNQNILARRDTQVFRSSWIGDYNDPWTFLQLLRTGFGINLTGYSNTKYDELLEQASEQADPVRRRELLERAERLMLAEQPLIPLYFYVNKHLVSPRLRGFSNNVMNVQYSKDLWFERPRT